MHINIVNIRKTILASEVQIKSNKRAFEFVF